MIKIKNQTRKIIKKDRIKMCLKKINKSKKKIFFIKLNVKENNMIHNKNKSLMLRVSILKKI